MKYRKYMYGKQKSAKLSLKETWRSFHKTLIYKPFCWQLTVKSSSKPARVTKFGALVWVPKIHWQSSQKSGVDRIYWDLH